MRRLVLAAVMAVMAQGAQAADLPDLSDLPILRGGFSDGLSRSSVNWQGAYVGGQFGYSSGTMDFSQATSSLTQFLFRNTNLEEFSETPLLGRSHANGTSFGGFVGYNAQWDDVVLGIEANYSRLSGFSNGSQASYGPVATGKPCGADPVGGDSCSIILSLDGSASAKVTDVLTLRGRAGWAIDNFMPYMFGGLALGRADIYRTVVPDAWGLHAVAPTKRPLSQFQTASDGGDGNYMYGFTAGLGLEAMLFGNVFVRGEYEYIKFSKIKDIDIQINTVRAGVGYKF